MYRAKSLDLLRKHDVIKIGPKQKGNVFRVVQLSMLQRSVCMLYNNKNRTLNFPSRHTVH